MSKSWAQCQTHQGGLRNGASGDFFSYQQLSHLMLKASLELAVCFWASLCLGFLFGELASQKGH